MGSLSVAASYLKTNNLIIACICNTDENGNDYDHIFYLCKKGEANSTAWKLEIKKMENVALFECDLDQAIKLGFESIEDCFNYEERKASQTT